MPGVKRGVLISFEGVEGSGKTTQATALVKWLTEKGLPTLFVREPGSTTVSEKIRHILLDPEVTDMHPKCEVLLFLAARVQLVYQKILPALLEKTIVVTDRYIDSTFAYQIYARNLPKRLLSIFNRFASAGLKPDITLLFDIDINEGRKRGVFEDRMETQELQYHEKVRQGYLTRARRARKRIKVLPGAQTFEDLHKQVINHTTNLLKRKGFRV